MKLPTFETSEGRKAWAFAALVGAAQVFTLFAAFAVWQLRNTPESTLWLGLAAHAQVFVVLFAIGALLVRRTVKVGREGLEISDQGEPPATVTTTTVAVEVKDV